MCPLDGVNLPPSAAGVEHLLFTFGGLRRLSLFTPPSVQSCTLLGTLCTVREGAGLGERLPNAPLRGLRFTWAGPVGLSFTQGITTVRLAFAFAFRVTTFLHALGKVSIEA